MRTATALVFALLAASCAPSTDHDVATSAPPASTAASVAPPLPAQAARRVGAPVAADAERTTCPRTALAGFDLAVALARGHVDRFGREPEELRWMGVWALAALENQHGERLYGWSFGNLVPAAGARACDHPAATEKEGGPVRLRASSSPTEGASALWAALGAPDGPVFDHLDRGDWAAFAQDLEHRRFFRADPVRYRRALPSLADGAIATLLPKLRAARAARHVAFSELPLTITVTKSMPVLLADGSP